MQKFLLIFCVCKKGINFLFLLLVASEKFSFLSMNEVSFFGASFSLFYEYKQSTTHTHTHTQELHLFSILIMKTLLLAKAPQGEQKFFLCFVSNKSKAETSGRNYSERNFLCKLLHLLCCCSMTFN